MALTSPRTQVKFYFSIVLWFLVVYVEYMYLVWQRWVNPATGWVLIDNCAVLFSERFSLNGAVAGIERSPPENDHRSTPRVPSLSHTHLVFYFGVPRAAAALHVVHHLGLGSLHHRAWYMYVVQRWDTTGSVLSYLSYEADRSLFYPL